MTCICHVAAAASGADEMLACLQQGGDSYSDARFSAANATALTDAIVHHRLKAVTAISKPHAKATVQDSAVSFVNTMKRISSAQALDTINVSAAMRALVAVWQLISDLPSASHREREQYAMHVRLPAAKLLQRLQQMLPQTGTYHASSILLYGARLQLPKLMHSLSLRLSQL